MTRGGNDPRNGPQSVRYPAYGNRHKRSLNLAALQNAAAWLISRKTFKLKNLVLHRKTNHADVPRVFAKRMRRSAVKHAHP